MSSDEEISNKVVTSVINTLLDTRRVSFGGVDSWSDSLQNLERNCVVEGELNDDDLIVGGRVKCIYRDICKGLGNTRDIGLSKHFLSKFCPHGKSLKDKRIQKKNEEIEKLNEQPEQNNNDLSTIPINSQLVEFVQQQQMVRSAIKNSSFFNSTRNFDLENSVNNFQSHLYRLQCMTPSNASRYVRPLQALENYSNIHEEGDLTIPNFNDSDFFQNIDCTQKTPKKEKGIQYDLSNLSFNQSILFQGEENSSFCISSKLNISLSTSMEDMCHGSQNINKLYLEQKIELGLLVKFCQKVAHYDPSKINTDENTYNSIQRFLKNITSKFNAPLLAQLKQLNDENIQLVHELKYYRELIDSDNSKTGTAERETIILGKVQECLVKLDEKDEKINILQRQLQVQKEHIELIIESETKNEQQLITYSTEIKELKDAQTLNDKKLINLKLLHKEEMDELSNTVTTLQDKALVYSKLSEDFNGLKEDYDILQNAKEIAESDFFKRSENLKTEVESLRKLKVSQGETIEQLNLELNIATASNTTLESTVSQMELRLEDDSLDSELEDEMIKSDKYEKIIVGLREQIIILRKQHFNSSSTPIKGQSKNNDFEISALKARIYQLEKEKKLYETVLSVNLTAKANACNYPFCDGQGNINGKSKTHYTLKGCPNKEKNPVIENFIQLRDMQAETSANEIEVLKSENLEIKDRIRNKELEINIANLKIQQNFEEIDRMKIKQHNTQIELRFQENNNRSLDSCLQNSEKTRNDSYIAATKEIESLNNRISTDNFKYNECIGQIREAKEICDQKIISLSAELEMLNYDYRESMDWNQNRAFFENQINQQTDSYNKLKSNYDHLKVSNDAHFENLTGQQKTNYNLLTSIQELKNQIKDHEDKIKPAKETFESNIKKLTSIITELRIEIKDAKRISDAKIEELNKLVEQRQGEIIYVNEISDTIIQELNQLIEQRHKEINDAKRISDTEIQQLNDLVKRSDDKEIRRLKKFVDKRQNDLACAKIISDTEIQRLHVLLEKRQNEIQRLKERVAKRQNEELNETIQAENNRSPKRKSNDHNSSNKRRRSSGNSTILINEGGEERTFNLQRIGTHSSHGHADGRPVYKGPCGGFFYLGKNGWKSYLGVDQRESVVLDSRIRRRRRIISNRSDDISSSSSDDISSSSSDDRSSRSSNGSSDNRSSSSSSRSS